MATYCAYYVNAYDVRQSPLSQLTYEPQQKLMSDLSPRPPKPIGDAPLIHKNVAERGVI